MKKLARLFCVAIIIVGLGIYAFSRGRIFLQKDRYAPEISEHHSTAEENLEDRVEDYGTPTDDDPWIEMEHLVGTFFSSAGRDCSGVIRTIDATGDVEKTLETSRFTYQQAGNKSAYSVDSIQVITTEKLIVVANADLETVSVAPRGGEVTPVLFDVNQFRHLMSERKAEASVSLSGDMKILTIDHIEDPQIQGYRIYYNSETYEIKKMVVGFARLTPIDGSATIQEMAVGMTSELIETYTYFVEIEYSECHSLNPELFDPLAAILAIKDGHTVLQKRYENYQLQNLAE